MKKVVLIGASGFVGSAILNEALNREIQVTAVVRHPEKIKIQNENLIIKKADWDESIRIFSALFYRFIIMVSFLPYAARMICQMY